MYGALGRRCRLCCCSFALVRLQVGMGWSSGGSSIPWQLLRLKSMKPPAKSVQQVRLKWAEKWRH